MTTPETVEMQPEFSPELICIAEMQGSLKKRLTFTTTRRAGDKPPQVGLD